MEVPLSLSLIQISVPQESAAKVFSFGMVTNIPRSQVRITVNCILNSSFHFNGLTIAIGKIKSTELEFRTGGRGGGGSMSPV